MHSEWPPASIFPVLKPPKPTTFDDQLWYNTASHEFWRDLDSSSPQYFGPPSPEIDFAWNRLLLGEFPGISDDEIRLNADLHFEDQDRNPATGHFHIAIDVFHSLHCLNAVRKELDRDYYLSNTLSDPASLISNQSAAPSPRRSRANHHDLWSAKSQRIHIDHCLNHIRQNLQCHPDLSPAAMTKQISSTGDVFFLGNSEKHTCRDWNEIRRWVDERRMSELGAWEE
jgi:Mycotoxin biosynthesis protein UstYa